MTVGLLEALRCSVLVGVAVVGSGDAVRVAVIVAVVLGVAEAVELGVEVALRLGENEADGVLVGVAE